MLECGHTLEQWDHSKMLRACFYSDDPHRASNPCRCEDCQDSPGSSSYCTLESVTVVLETNATLHTRDKVPPLNTIAIRKVLPVLFEATGPGP
jgi:hypothetical protein